MTIERRDMVKKSNVKVGMIGLGYWGKNILRSLYESKVLHTACDCNSEIIKMRKKDFPEIDYTLYFQDILNNPGIKAVVISTPAATHYELVKEALNADKDIFVEKPLALNFARGKELVTLAKEKKKILMVGHILQYHPAVIKLKEMIGVGELGKIQYIYSNRLNIGKLRTEENILWSFAPHDISAMLMLLDEEPIRVTAFGGRYITEGIYDTTLTTLEFKNGIRGHIFVSWLHPYKEQKLIVVGTKAMAVFDDVSKAKLFIYPHKINYISGKIPIVQKAEYCNIFVENKEPLKEELNHFIECVNERKQPQTNGEEGIRVLRVLEEAEKSLQNPTVIVSEGKQSQQDKKYFVHETSFIDEDVQIGENTQIWHFSHILKGSRIGKNCKIGQNVVIGPKVKIGNGCKIQNNISIYQGVTFEDEVFCGPSCVFTNVFNPRSAVPRMDELRTTLIEKGVTIGANATIICGHTIGRCAFIGAGAVVTKDVPGYALVYGNSAKIVGWMCECGNKLEFIEDKAQCLVCHKQYKKDGNTIRE